LPLTDFKLDLLDTVASHSCGLDQLIGQRNSSLGKVQSISQRLQYEVALLTALPNCLTDTALTEKLRQKLTLVYQQKAAEMPLLWANVLHTDTTLRQQWLMAPDYLPLQHQAGLSDTLAALQQLVQLSQFVAAEQWRQLNQSNIEQPLAQLYQAGYLARWLHTLALHLSLLQQTNVALATVEWPKLCPKGKHRPEPERLQAVLLQVFIPKIQAELALLDGGYQQFWPLLTKLYQHSSNWPVLEQRFSTPLQQLKAELKHHVRWWQQFEQQCQP